MAEYLVPQIAGHDEPFGSAIREHFKGHAQRLEDLAVETLARGLSVCDIEDAFKDESLFKKLRAMTPPIGDVDVQAAIRHGLAPARLR